MSRIDQVPSDVIALTSPQAVERLSVPGHRAAVAALSFGLVIGYESTLHASLFPRINLAVIGGFFLLTLIQWRGTMLRPHEVPSILFGAAVVYGSTAQVLLSGISMESLPHLMKLPAQFALVLAMLSLVTRQTTRRILQALNILIIAVAVINLPIALFGSFLFWSEGASRAAAIFHDPNYAGVVFGFSLLYTLATKQLKPRLRYAALGILAIAVVSTFSKGALLSILISLLWLWARRRPVLFLLFGPPVAFVASRGLDSVLTTLNLHMPALRIGMGLNSRDLFWSDALHGIIERPFLGHSQQEVFLLIDYYAENTSLHNYYIETAYLYGVPFTIMVVCLLAVSFFRSAKAAPDVNVVLVYLAVAANDFTFSLGSVGLLPFLFTLVVVYPFQRSEKEPSRALR